MIQPRSRALLFSGSCLALALALVACGGGSASSETPVAPESQVAPEPASTGAPVEGAEGTVPPEATPSASATAGPVTKP